MPRAPRRRAGRSPRPRSLAYRLTTLCLLFFGTVGIGGRPGPAFAQGFRGEPPGLGRPGTLIAQGQGGSPSAATAGPADARPDPNLRTGKQKADHIIRRAKEEIAAAQAALAGCERHAGDWDDYLAKLMGSLGRALGFDWKKAAQDYAKGDPQERQVRDAAIENEGKVTGLVASALGGKDRPGAIEECARKLGKKFANAEWAKRLYDAAEGWRHALAVEVAWTGEIKALNPIGGVMNK